MPVTQQDRLDNVAAELQSERKRKKLKFSVAEFRSGINRGGIHRLENEGSNPTLSRLLALSDAYGIKASTLLRRAGE